MRNRKGMENNEKKKAFFLEQPKKVFDWKKK